MITDHQRVLYLDSDMLVLGEIERLLRADLSGLPIGAVQDSQHPVVGKGISLPGWRDLGIDEGRPYFNSGVLLMDLEHEDQSEIVAKALDVLQYKPEAIMFWDQDALNYAVDGRWKQLDARWNTLAISPLVGLPGFLHDAGEETFPLPTLIAREPRARILHFAGPAKPWTADYPDGPMKDLYRTFSADAS
jgi:lipopolysaccharide biosynthesis glycosyltransferase